MLKNANDSLSYGLGVLIASNLKQQGFADIDVDQFSKGLAAALKGDNLLITQADAEKIIREEGAKMKMKMHEVNKKAGEDFLAENKKRPGVITLDNGLQYEVMKEGNGAKPKASDEVNVHYHGTLISGEEFDSSVSRGEPISFKLSQVIKGWTEILQLMPIGSKWRVYIPYDLAYGERSAGPHIQPYSTLIFEIELLGIN